MLKKQSTGNSEGLCMRQALVSAAKFYLCCVWAVRWERCDHIRRDEGDILGVLGLVLKGFGHGYSHSLCVMRAQGSINNNLVKTQPWAFGTSACVGTRWCRWTRAQNRGRRWSHSAFLLTVLIMFPVPPPRRWTCPLSKALLLTTVSQLGLDTRSGWTNTFSLPGI